MSIGEPDKKMLSELNQQLLNRQLKIERECYASDSPKEFLKCINRYSFFNDGVINKVEGSFIFYFNAYRNCVDSRISENFCSKEYVQNLKRVYNQVLQDY